MTHIVDCCVFVWCAFPDMSHIPICIVHSLGVGGQERLGRNLKIGV